MSASAHSSAIVIGQEVRKAFPATGAQHQSVQALDGVSIESEKRDIFDLC